MKVRTKICHVLVKCQFIPLKFCLVLSMNKMYIHKILPLPIYDVEILPFQVSTVAVLHSVSHKYLLRNTDKFSPTLQSF